MQNLNVRNLVTPVGNLLLAENDRSEICVCTFDGEARFEAFRTKYAPEVTVRWVEFDHPILLQLSEYFEGTRESFSVDTYETGTEFQKRVYAALREIPYGETVTYAQLATRLEQPKAIRAVGTANGQNPIAILNPCHRVIGSDGAMRGFAGGIDIKRALLERENAACVSQIALF